jgi:hypothetical protein
MGAAVRPVWLLAVAALVACGGTQRTPAEAAARCLNERGYLVQADGEAVRGSSPNGVNFTLTLSGSNAVVDDSGNPPRRAGSPPAKLARGERTEIESCAGPS